MAALVAAERHLWLTLSDMKEKDRVFLLDAPLSPSGLFGDSVNSVVDRYQEARKQAAAFQRFLPLRHPAREAAGREQPRSSTSSSYRDAQKQSVATRTPPHRERVVLRSKSVASKARPDLRETALLTLPVLHGTAASSEHTPRFLPPGNVAGPGSSLPPRGSQGPPVQVLPAGKPLQDTVLAAQLTPETSLERLVPLVDHLATWKLLPNVSAWVLHTVERGYQIQFGAPPPPFIGVSPTLVGPEESGFYSRYFIVPKKDGGLCPILDLCVLNRSVMKLKFRMLTLKQVVSQIRCGAGVAEASSVRFSPDHSAPGSSRESAPGRGVPPPSSPVLAGPSMVFGPDFSPRWLSMGDSRQEGSPLTGGGHHVPPSPGAVEALGVASEGAHLLASGLSTEVVETILQSRAPTTRKLYALKWKLFTSWCGRHQQDPVNCPVGTVLEFLQDRLSAGLSHSTLKVYVAAIAAYHAPLGGLSVEALCRPPFEPIEEISDRHLTIKTVLLIAITSLKRAGDLQALSVAPSFLDFAPGLAKAFLHPRPGYIPKVPSSAPRPVVLQAFCPPPFREPDQQKLNCMCPIRALDTYVHRAAMWRKSDQLFVCYGPAKRGFPATKQTLSRWIVDAISSAYESSGLPPPLGVKAHSTRSVSASKAFLEGVSMQDICNAAGWSTPLTFVRFFDLDLRVAPGSSVLRPSSF
ncbi:hypothetical protein H4Q32_025038 [Labeo rohita]|uniref:Uncharacterized protein n=1 Tax=Labeo rohita TaxID=84645 RepID=A0ABQ8L880_LABRO|nr:hypothetical protein H4Q32_025038 [Labeo rohita]